jgi:hypothetical protein
MKSEWVGFVHGLDDSGRLVSQDDRKLLADGRPTTGWLPGEVAVVTYSLKDANKVRSLEIGVYRQAIAGLERLPAFDAHGGKLGDSFRVLK